MFSEGFSLRGKAGLPALAVGLLALLAVEFIYDWANIVETKRDVGDVSVAADGGLTDRALASLLNETPAYGDYFSAPVFSQDRRPLSLISIGGPTDSGAVDARLVLLGTIVTEDGRVALFRTEQGNEVLRGGLGQTIAGWSIDELDPTQVKISRGGETAVLILPSVSNNESASRGVRRRKQND